MSGLVSAIIPTYNRADFLVEAVSALRSQTRPLHEIIIWDDGSQDQTKVVMEKLQQEVGPLLRCFSKPNAGKSRALNSAIAEATGDYIWICDDDDIVLPTAAETLAGVLDTSDVGMVGARHVRFSVDPKSGERVLFDTGYWPNMSEGSPLRHLLEDIFFFQPATMVRRSAFDIVGPFREDIRRSIDYEMFVRLAARVPVKVLDEVVFEQRKHDGARGAGSGRHDASESEAVWKANDKSIFTVFRSSLPLSLYEALFEGPDHTLITRAALLQRGCVYARRSDWDPALEDFRTALAMLPDQPLSATEHAIAIRVLAGKHGCADAFVRPVAPGLLNLKSLGAAGPSFCQAIAKGSVWRLRSAIQQADFRQAMRISRFMLSMGPPRHAPTHSSSRELSERRSLIPVAYQW